MEVKINATPLEGSEEKEKKYGKYDEWEICSAVDCLLRAEEIKNDKEKMAYVKPLLDEKMGNLSKAIRSLSDLKAVAKKKMAEEETEDDE